MISLLKDNKMLGYALLNAYPNISHFVTTRQGGYSQGAYEFFNCAPFSGDSLENVRLNQQLLVEELPHRPIELIIPMQTHSTSCLVIDEAFLASSKESRMQLLTGVDALITNQSGYCLCISTADCVPVLIYDQTHHVVAAVHAGWRGTVGRIVEVTLQEMNRRFGTIGEDVVACIGPSISPQAFEVGEEVYDTFLTAGFDMSKLSKRHPQTGKPHIDLWEANKMQLQTYGVPDKQIEVAGICTYTSHERFFSARRLGIHSGRIMSGIMIH